MDQSLWKWLVENLWLPALSVIGVLIGIVRQGDLHRIQSLEKKVKDYVTKDELLKVEILAQNAVQQERFKDYVDQIEKARVESRDLLATMLLKIEQAQQRADDKLGILTERVIAHGLARDERREPR